MKRICFAMAAMAVVASGAARADFGGPPAAPTPGTGPYSTAGQGQPNPAEKERYGLLPAIKEVVFWKKDAVQPVPPPVPMGYPRQGMPGMYGQGMPGYGAPGCAPGMGGAPGMYGQGTPGTLVFPNHQFSRSPRDFFMWQPGR